MKKLILGLLLIYSVSVVEASSSQQTASDKTSSGVAIGYNPADFTFTVNGKSLLGSGLMAMIITGLDKVRCSENSSKSYALVESENPRFMEIIEKEIKLSNSIYADPATRLIPNIIGATHLLKGDAIVEKGIASINFRIEDRQGNVTAQAKVSGPEKDLLKLIDKASESLGQQMCQPEQPEIQPCPYLWNITFKQSGTLNTNICFGTGLSDEEAMSPVDGYAYFPNVLIRPSASYELTFEEDDACNYHRKNDIQNNYSAKSKGDTYLKIDGFDGMDVDAVYLRVLNINKGKKSMIFEFGSVPITDVLSKITGSKRPQDSKSFQLTEGCNQVFTFTPVPVYIK